MFIDRWKAHSLLFMEWPHLDNFRHKQWNVKWTRIRIFDIWHDNARPHTAQLTKMAIQELGWEVLPHPPYSPDLAPSDYHLFRSLSNQMRGMTFDNEKAFKNWLVNFFNSRPGDFWRNGINKLVD